MVLGLGAARRQAVISIIRAHNESPVFITATAVAVDGSDVSLVEQDSMSTHYIYWPTPAQALYVAYLYR